MAKVAMASVRVAATAVRVATAEAIWARVAVRAAAAVWEAKAVAAVWVARAVRYLGDGT